MPGMGGMGGMDFGGGDSDDDEEEEEEANTTAATGHEHVHGENCNHDHEAPKKNADLGDLDAAAE